MLAANLTVLALGLAWLLRLVWLELRNKDHIWHDPCITEQADRDLIRHVLRAFLAASRNHRLRWWVDYGTLLGAWRLADVMAYDFDLDVGFLAEDVEAVRALARELEPQGIVIDLERTSIFYQGRKLGDVEPWFRHGTMLARDQDLSRRRGVLKWDRILCDDFPAAWVERTRSILLAGDFYPCPHPVERFLRRRYPSCRLHLRICFPHRQRCWVCPDYWREVWRIWTYRGAPVVR